MTERNCPFVSVVTPVYNGQQYLAECLESVMAQGYGAFELVVVDNASTDKSLEIARQHAARDPRIRVIACSEHLPVIANWNRALSQIADHAAYVRVLPCDDALMGQCLTRMVEVAQRHPDVGVVSSLRVRGRRVQCSGLSPRRECFSGREIGRLFLSEKVFAFSPTGSMVRRDLIEATRPFYPDRYLHGDVAAFLNILDRADFGFVHALLMYSREHEGSVTSTVADRKGSQFRDWLLMLQEFGPRYFTSEEQAALEKQFLRRYYRYLVRSAVLMRERKLFEYHMDALRAAGHLPGPGALARATLGEVERALLKPLLALAYVRRRIHWNENLNYLWHDR